MITHLFTSAHTPASERTVQPRCLRIRYFLSLALWLIAPAGFAATITWTGLAGDKNWSSVGNWDSNSVPVLTNDVVFGAFDTATATSGPNGLSNSVVDISTAIQSLQFANLDSLFHTAYIPLGNTLSISPTQTVGGISLYVGTGTASGSLGPQIYATINGPGTLVVSNSNATINVRQGNTSNNGCLSTLDLSGLSTFYARVNRILLGGDGTAAAALNRTHGIMLLAATNTVLLTGTPGMTLGCDTAGANNDSGDLQLGQTNVFLCDSGIALGLSKGTGSIEFRTGLVNPSVTFRNLAGTGRQANWTIGDASQFSAASTSCSGTLDFTLGYVDAMVDTLILGKGQNGTGAGTGNGTLLFSAGTIDVNNVTIGTCNSGGNRVGGVGTLTVNGPGQLTVNGDMQIGMQLGSTTGNTKPQGTLTVNSGASVWVKGNIIDGASVTGLNAVNVVSGALKVGGQIGRTNVGVGALENLSLTSANLTLTLSGAINANNPVCRVTNLTVTTALTINILGGNFGLGQYPLIQYLSGSIAGDGYPVVALGSLPPRTFAYLSNNTAASSIDLVVTNISSIKWNGNVAGGNWDTNGTANWKDTISGAAASYLETTIPGDTTLFDDSATGTTIVNLVTNLSPTTVTVSNATKTYIFKGPGGLSSSAGPLTKNGAATLIISNSGPNIFGGAITINAGLVQLGLSSNRLPTTANMTIANATGAGLDLGDQDQAINSLSGGGASGGNINLGAGSLKTSAAGDYAGVISGTGGYSKIGSGGQIFEGANTYQGGTFVNGGSLTLVNSTGSGTGTGAISIGTGASLNLGNGGTSGSIPGSVVVTNNGLLTFNRTDSVTFGNLITGIGGVLQNNSNTVAFPTANNYSGGTTILWGPMLVSNPLSLGTGTIYVQNPGVNGGGIFQTPTSTLMLQGGINITNRLQFDQKNAGFGVVPLVESVSGVNTLSGPIQLFIGGSYWRFQVDAGKLNITGPVANQTSGSRLVDFIGTGDGEWSSGIPEGTGTTSVYMDATGTWTLSGTNTYTGVTSVSSGKLVVNGQIQSLNNVTVNTGGTLGGTGIISGPLEITSGGTLAPGNSIGTLTVANTVTLDTGCTNLFDVNSDTLASDSVVGMLSVTYGGNLVLDLTGSGSALVNGAAIKLFDAQSYSGSFDSITPAIPSVGHTWNTETLLTDGTLRIGPLHPNITSITSPSPGSWQLNGTGEEGASYHVLAATNIVLPLNQWWVLGSGTISGGVYSFTDNTATNKQRFYRVVTP